MIHSTPDALSDRHQYEKSTVLIKLLKGPLFRQQHRDLWQLLERDEVSVRAYFQSIGLTVFIDDAEGYAFLKQEDLEDNDSLALPRLMTRRQLSFSQSLLLVLIRKRLAEHDSEESAPRLIITRDEMHQALMPFFPDVSNELKQRDSFDSLIKKTQELGFISPLKNHKDDFEVQRIIKAFITPDQITDFLAQIAEYQTTEQGDN